jgi:hypothetical protein
VCSSIPASAPVFFEILLAIFIRVVRCFDHLVRTARRAISVFRDDERARALAGPPTRPPSLPSCTALGFFMLRKLSLDRSSIKELPCETEL